MLNRKQRAHRSQTTGLGRIGRVLLSVAIGSAALVGFSFVEAPSAHAYSASDGLQWWFATQTGNTDSNLPQLTITSSTTGYCSYDVNTINFAWGTGQPGSCGNPVGDGFSGYGDGYIVSPYTGTITFCDQADDGMVVKIDGAAVLSDWEQQGADGYTAGASTCAAKGSISNSATWSATRGQVYHIQVYYHENTGGADARLLWNYSGLGGFYLIPQSNLSTTSAGLYPTISISPILPTYGYGNTTYTYGTGITTSNCGADQASACSYAVSSKTASNTYSLSAGSITGNIVQIADNTTGSFVYNSSGTFNAGTYTGLKVTITDANGLSTQSSAFQIQIAKAPISIKSSSASKVFGNSNPNLNGYSITNGSLVFSDSISVTGSSSAVDGSSVGQYSITPSVTFPTLSAQCSSVASNCYSVTLISDTLTVSARPITVKANSVSRTFGTANPTFSGYTITSGTMYSTDTFTASETTTATIGSNVGTYPITQGTYAFSSGSQSNYAITFVNDTLTVTARPLTVKANSLTKNYGDANPSLTGYSITSGSMYSTDTFTVNGSTTSAQGSSVGSYPVTQTLNSFTTGTASNYSLTFVADTLTISTRPVTVKANSISRSYGTANPSLTGFTITSGSVYNTDTFTVTGSTTATQGSAVGTYPISQVLNSFGTGTASNYALTFTSDTLTVTAKPLTVKANSLTRKYGLGNPNLNGFTITSGSTYSTDTFTVTGTTAATTNSNVGTYPVTQSLNTFTSGSSSNYNINYQADTLTVTKADTLTITANTLSDVTYKFSGATITPGFTTSGLAGSDTITISSSTGYFYQPLSNPTCAQGGYCNVGDIGPAGGIVFLDLGASAVSPIAGITNGGRYLEAAPSGGNGWPVGISTTAAWCTGSTGSFSQDGIIGEGFGAYSTNIIINGTNKCTGGAVVNGANYSVNTYSDWYLPSASELYDMLSYASQIGLRSGTNYWSSSNWGSVPSQAFYVTSPTQYLNTEAVSTLERYWPIRAFDPTNLTPYLSGSQTKTQPSSTGSYQISIDSTTVSFTSGLASNYVSISYGIGTVNIVKANYQYLKVNANVSVLTYPYGQSLQLFAVSDPGDTTTVSFSVLNGTNSICQLTNQTTTTATLSASAIGGGNATCVVTLSRVATANFNYKIGESTTINFIVFVPEAVAPAFAGGGNMAIGIGGPIVNIPPVTGDTTTVTAATITSVYDNTTASSSVFHAGDSLTLTGSNLNGVTQIKFLGGGTTQTFAANSSQTSLTFTLPGDVATGPVLVQKPSPDGIGFKTGRFNITIS